MNTKIVIALLGGTLLGSPALAKDTLYFAGYSGDFQTMFEKEIAPEFEAKNDRVPARGVAGFHSHR